MGRMRRRGFATAGGGVGIGLLLALAGCAGGGPLAELPLPALPEFALPAIAMPAPPGAGPEAADAPPGEGPAAPEAADVPPPGEASVAAAAEPVAAAPGPAPGAAPARADRPRPRPDRVPPSTAAPSASLPGLGSADWLGSVTAEPGPATRPGLWAASAMVAAPVPGWVTVEATGRTAEAELLPLPPGAGTRLSPELARALGIPPGTAARVSVYRRR